MGYLEEVKLCATAENNGQQTMLVNKQCWSTNNAGQQTMLVNKQRQFSQLIKCRNIKS
jgi:Fe-S cluster biosynthesis and repair protein YggX